MADDDDKVVYLEQQRDRRTFDRMHALETALTDTLMALIHAYKSDPHWVEDMGIHALIEALVECAFDEDVSGWSVVKRLAYHMRWDATHKEDVWGADFARWFVKDLPAALTEYEDFKWYGDGA
jgi:hypothetical protein